jgi:hypothetical protein
MRLTASCCGVTLEDGTPLALAESVTVGVARNAPSYFSVIACVDDVTEA